MNLIICPNCHQHFIAQQSSCPHCARSPKKFSLATAVLLGLGLSACSGKSTDTSSPNDTSSPSDTAPIAQPDTAMGLEYGVPWVDEDGDGFSADYDDCDDGDASTFPGSAENDSQTDCMKDSDDDGYGDSNVVSPIVPGSDCNDDNPEENPGSSDSDLDCQD